MDERPDWASLGSHVDWIANPVTARLARKLRTGLREVWGAVGGEVDADSTSLLAFLERKGLTREAPRQGRDEEFTQLQQWLIPEATDPPEVGWAFFGDVLRNSGRREVTSKLRTSATSVEPRASDVKRRELALAGLNRRGESEIADMIAGS